MTEEAFQRSGFALIQLLCVSSHSPAAAHGCFRYLFCFIKLLSNEKQNFIKNRVFSLVFCVFIQNFHNFFSSFFPIAGLPRVLHAQSNANTMPDIRPRHNVTFPNLFSQICYRNLSFWPRTKAGTSQVCFWADACPFFPLLSHFFPSFGFCLSTGFHWRNFHIICFSYNSQVQNNISESSHINKKPPTHTTFRSRSTDFSESSLPNNI